MALSIDYSTYIIFVPKTYTQFVSTDPQTGLEVRQMDLTIFAQDVADLQDDPEGAWAATAYEYTSPVSVGGVQLAPVVIILSPYTVEFEDGQYAVNLVGANTNVQDKVIVNQVSIRPNNSAGLTFSDAINEQSYQDASVWIDTNDGNPGISFPRGTPTDPVDNPIDANTIAMSLNLHDFKLRGTMTLPNGMDGTKYGVMGTTPTDSVIVFDATIIEKAAFQKIGAVGTVTGRGTFRDCSLGKTVGLSGLQGLIDHCGLAGTITLEASATEPIVFIDCVSAIAGTSKPMLNCNGTAAGINFRRYAGGLDISNFSNALGAMTLDLLGSEVKLNSASCTDGVIVCRGIGKLIDENGTEITTGTWNGITVVNQSVYGPIEAIGGSITEQDKLDIADRVWDESAAAHIAAGSMGEKVQVDHSITEQDKDDIVQKTWDYPLP